MVIDIFPDAERDPRPVGRPISELGRIGGRLCLDFVNTVNGTRARPGEWLVDYPTLVRWGREVGVLSPGRARKLLQRARDRPAEAEPALVTALETREALFRIFEAAVRGRTPDPPDLDRVNDATSRALARLRVIPEGAGFAWEPEGEDGLDALLGPIVRDAADLLVSEDLARVKECDGHDCTWLFVDESRNRSRRWCDMAVCGNRMKARRHYRRRREGG